MAGRQSFKVMRCFLSCSSNLKSVVAVEDPRRNKLSDRERTAGHGPVTLLVPGLAAHFQGVMFVV